MGSQGEDIRQPSYSIIIMPFLPEVRGGIGRGRCPSSVFYARRYRTSKRRFPCAKELELMSTKEDEKRVVIHETWPTLTSLRILVSMQTPANASYNDQAFSPQKRLRILGLSTCLSRLLLSERNLSNVPTAVSLQEKYIHNETSPRSRIRQAICARLAASARKSAGRAPDGLKEFLFCEKELW